MFLNSIRRIIKRLYSPKYLIITNSMTGIASMAVGDSLQQYIEFLQKDKDNEHKGFQLNKRRTFNMMCAGLYFGLFGHVWYSFLDRRFPGRKSGSVFKKLLSEMAMGPPLISGVFFVIGKLKGMTIEKSWHLLKANFVLICVVEWSVYIPLQYLNFTLINPQFRYLYVALISICYDAFLSYILHRVKRN